MNTLDQLVSENERSQYAREHIPPELRVNPEVRGWIDAGYIHHRAIYTFLESRRLDQILATPLMKAEQRPWYASKGFYTDLLLRICELEKALNLVSLTKEPANRMFRNQLICSIDCFIGVEFEHDEEAQKISNWIPPGKCERTAELRFRPAYAQASTTRSELREGALHSHISLLKNFDNNHLVIEPLLLGGPWLQHIDQKVENELDCYHLDFFENFIEDIAEFSKVREVPRPAPEIWMPFMANVPELEVKRFLCSLLQEGVPKDWPGETSDLFSTNIHLGEKRITGAFLLKGPSNFRPMTVSHLGKNGDQIYRLSQEPANLLVVQHSHEVTEAVRAHLRAFASQPWSQRRFMVIDGSDTYRILKAYGFQGQ